MTKRLKFIVIYRTKYMQRTLVFDLQLMKMKYTFVSYFLSCQFLCIWLQFIECLQQQIQIEMKSKSTKARQSSDHSDTCQSLPRTLPNKVIQVKVKHTYQRLAAIPLVSNLHNIKHLYLSHNNISTLKGIQKYIALTALNVSYNCLSKITELRLIRHPGNMKRVCLRMNSFQYGYEDYAVELFENLSRIDDCVLESHTKRVQLKKMRTFIGQQLLNFYKKTVCIIDQMQNQANKQNMMNLINTKSNKNTNKQQLKISTQYLNSPFFTILKQLFIFPTPESLSNKTIFDLVSLNYNILQIFKQAKIYLLEERRKQQSYMKQTKLAYKTMCDQILLKFATRHDRLLQNYIDHKVQQNCSYLQIFGKLGIFDESQYEVEKEIKLTSGVTTHKLTQQPSKYMDKLNGQSLKEHPINRLANWTQPHYQSLIDQKETKWYKFLQQPQQNDLKWTLFFQQIPMFIYCKEYIEVVSEIVMDRIGLILKLQNDIIQNSNNNNNNNNSSSNNNKNNNNNNNNNSSNYNKLDSFVLKEVQNDGISMKSGEIQLQLSDSQIMSFGNKDQHLFQPPKHSHIYIQQGQQEQFTIINSTVQQKKQRSYLQKYSLYQINIIFKVLRSLKKNAKKKINKRMKVNP